MNTHGPFCPWRNISATWNFVQELNFFCFLTDKQMSFISRNNQPTKKNSLDLFMMSKQSPNASAWMVVGATISLVFIILIWCFFYKVLVQYSPPKGHHVPWYGFGIFLFIIVTIYVFFALAYLVGSSIMLSEENKNKKKK